MYTAAIWNNIMLVASLIKDSPSINELNFFEAPASYLKLNTKCFELLLIKPALLWCLYKTL